MSIATRNIRGYRLHAGDVLRHTASVIGLQETEVPNYDVSTEHLAAKDEGCQLFFGNSTNLDTANSIFGRRVAIRTKHIQHVHRLNTQASDLVTLSDTGRWVEIMVPTGIGDKHVIVATLYGISGASDDKQKFVENERLLNIALARAMQFQDTPYFLIGDINVDPSLSLVVSTCIKTGLITDIARDRADNTNHIQPTFRRKGIVPEMDGSGVTRIDAMLTNRAGNLCIDNLNYHWDESRGYDHLMLSVTLNLDAFTAKALQLAKPIPIRLRTIRDIKTNDLDLHLRHHWALYAVAFNDYINLYE